MCFSACGGEETYAEQHLSTIEFDCGHTATCDPVFSLRADAVEECIKDTSAKLNNATDAARDMYNSRSERCGMYSGCDYYYCAIDTMLYSVVNQAKLQYECQQESFCKIMLGEPVATTANDDCFKALASRLDFAQISDRATWEQRFGRCQNFQACAYRDCK